MLVIISILISSVSCFDIWLRSFVGICVVPDAFESFYMIPGMLGFVGIDGQPRRGVCQQFPRILFNLLTLHTSVLLMMSISKMSVRNICIPGMIQLYTTLYLPPTGALASLSAAASVPSFNNRINSRIAFVTASSVSPSTRIYSFGFSPGPGSLPVG